MSAPMVTAAHSGSLQWVRASHSAQCEEVLEEKCLKMLLL